MSSSRSEAAFSSSTQCAGMEEIPYDGLDNDCISGDLVDVDEDGHAWDGMEGGTDCDDEDADGNPDVAEVPYDGVDNDCVDGDLVDVDGDGFDADIVEGGTDCNDDDGSIFPGAGDVDDEVDNDCDVLVDEDGVNFGDLIVTEVMANPGLDGFDGEWFEVHNPSSRSINMIGWSIRDDGSDLIYIDEDFVIDPDCYSYFDKLK